MPNAHTFPSIAGALCLLGQKTPADRGLIVAQLMCQLSHVSELQCYLSSPNTTVRYGAFLLLSELRSTEAFELLQAVCQECEAWLLAEGARLLSSFGERALPSLRTLFEQCKRHCPEEFRVRRYILLRALSCSAHAIPFVLDNIVEFAGADEEVVHAIVAHKKNAHPFLYEALGRRSAGQRFPVLLALAQCGEPEVLRELYLISSEPGDPVKRIGAVQALSLYHRAVPALRALLEVLRQVDERIRVTLPEPWWCKAFPRPIRNWIRRNELRDREFRCETLAAIASYNSPAMISRIPVEEFSASQPAIQHLITCCGLPQVAQIAQRFADQERISSDERLATIAALVNLAQNVVDTSVSTWLRQWLSDPATELRIFAVEVLRELYSRVELHLKSIQTAAPAETEAADWPRQQSVAARVCESLRALRPLLVERIETDCHVDVVALSLRALCVFEDHSPEIAQVFYRKARRGCASIRFEALRAIRAFPTLDVEAIDIAVDVLQTKDPSLQQEGLAILSRAGARAEKALPQVFELLLSDSVETQKWAQVALASIDPNGIATSEMFHPS